MGLVLLFEIKIVFAPISLLLLSHSIKSSLKPDWEMIITKALEKSNLDFSNVIIEGGIL